MNNIKKIITLLSVLILFLIIIFTIIPNRNKRTLEIKPEQLNQVSTSTEMIIEESNDFYIITAKYPVDKRDTKKDIERYVKSIIDSVKEEWSLEGELYKNELKLREDFPDRPIIKYELNIQYDSYSSSNLDTSSYVLRSYIFTGGAHGNTTLQTFTFNKNGLLTIEDLLVFNYKKTPTDAVILTREVAKKLQNILKDQYNEEMLNDGLGLNNSSSGFIHLTNFMNFIVLDDGIKFIYEQYQVASYAAGNPEVMFTWEELEKFLIK